MKRRAFLLAVAAASLAPAFAQSRSMKIGVIGSGRIGSTIGALWAKAGHEVMFSDRDADQVKRAIDALAPELKARARAGSVAAIIRCRRATASSARAWCAPSNSWGYSVMAREANRPAPRMAIPVAAGSLAASKAFDLGSAVSGRVLTAAEMRQALQLRP